MKPSWYGLKNAWNWGNTRNCAGNLESVVCVCVCVWVCVNARAQWLRKRARMRGNGQFGVRLKNGREGWSIWTKTHYFVHENHVLYFQRLVDFFQLFIMIFLSLSFLFVSIATLYLGFTIRLTDQTGYFLVYVED